MGVLVMVVCVMAAAAAAAGAACHPAKRSTVGRLL
jgi:hypothetical protein